MPFVLQAQHCKIVKEKDAFTGKTKVSYSIPIGTEILCVSKVDGICSIEISSTVAGVMQQGVEKGATGQFRLVNNELVSFVAKENSEPTVNLNGIATAYKSTLVAGYTITEQELIKLSRSAPVAIKFQLGGKEIVSEFSTKKGKKLKAAVKCILEFND